jgi:hypothetical protein
MALYLDKTILVTDPKGAIFPLGDGEEIHNHVINTNGSTDFTIIQNGIEQRLHYNGKLPTRNYP